MPLAWKIHEAGWTARTAGGWRVGGDAVAFDPHLVYGGLLVRIAGLAGCGMGGSVGASAPLLSR